jgi:hypothetical protein
MLRGTDVGVADGRGPVVTDAHALEQLERSTLAWSPACIRFESVGILVEDAPKSGGVDILADGSISVPWIVPAGSDVEVIYNAFSAIMTTDVLDAFYGAPMTGANAMAMPPLYQPFAHGGKTFILMAPKLDLRYRTLAHEFGHALGNAMDVANDQPVFFPALTTYKDDAENSYRRFSLATENTSRTTRPLGNLNAPGNTYLKNP